MSKNAANGNRNPADAFYFAPMPRRTSGIFPMKLLVTSVLAASALCVTGAVLLAAPAQKAPAKAPQKVLITLPMDYKDKPAATVKAGQPVALTFYLKSEAGCGDTVVLPAAKWKKTLKVGEKATVIYTPTKSGPLAFQCGMNMMKGSLLVK